jgi:N-acetylated-alpha-linked acidic dipeptidase
MSRTLASYLVAAACVYACLPDKDELAHLRTKRNARSSHSRHVKRDVVPFPPVLTETETLLVNSFDNNSISDWSLYYSSGYRLAGHNRSQAEWTQQKWIENGWESWIDEYWIWYTEPIESTLTLNRADGSAHEVQRLEDALDVDAQTNNPNEQPAYHALSGSGRVNAEYVYVGRGSREDYQKLKDLGVELEGKIALAQYGGANRGVKIKNAEVGLVKGNASPLS